VSPVGHGMKRAYEEFDELIDALRGQSLNAPANRLHSLLHETAWTTGSEFLGELGNEIRKIRKQHGRELDSQTREKIRICLSGINKVSSPTLWVRVTDLLRR